MVPGTCLARRADRQYVAGMAGASEHADTGADGDEPVYLEPRWPIALVLSLFIALTIVIRALQAHRESLLNPWLVPGVEIALLAALIAADPLHVGRRSRWLRRVGIVLVLCLVAAALVATAVLVADLVRGGKVTESASTLLTSGVLIWLGNCLAFGLLYWLLDSGGPLARYRHERPYPDFAFSQQLNPELAPTRLAASLRRLPHPRRDDEHGVQPDRRHADERLGEAHDGAAVDRLAARDRPRHRPRRQRLHLAL